MREARGSPLEDEGLTYNCPSLAMCDEPRRVEANEESPLFSVVFPWGGRTLGKSKSREGESLAKSSTGRRNANFRCSLTDEDDFDDGMQWGMATATRNVTTSEGTKEREDSMIEKIATKPGTACENDGEKSVNVQGELRLIDVAES